MPPKYNIEDLDLSSRRSIDIDHLDDSVAIVRNFFHDGRFWRARIPLNEVDAIFGQAFNFSSLKRRKTQAGAEVVKDKRGNPKPRFGFINHVQSRFRLRPGKTVQLYELDDETNDTPAEELSDFVYSIEAVGPPGVTFDFRNGMSGNLMCAHRFLSTKEMVFERVVILGYYVRESPALPLSDEEKKNILVRSLQRSDVAGLDETYYLYRCCGTNNCTSNPFAIIDSSVNYNFWQRLGSFLYRLPLNPRLYLRVRGLDADPNHFCVVRDEFSQFIDHPDTRKRKREVVREEIRKRRALKQAAAG